MAVNGKMSRYKAKRLHWWSKNTAEENKCEFFNSVDLRNAFYVLNYSSLQFCQRFFFIKELLKNIRVSPFPNTVKIRFACMRKVLCVYRK